ncbi:hypothetical protein TEA_000442 [Camellia sinensis var. sinensis]|uniref:Sugar phosphate transporter domain-containing protein n=1 Tax=Camellia sinensis var. sinensis TaxID=542762 RepID=A0A4S4D8C7_CAMSN|nr:hypothetical protein TEA_000442 [Camellia sinensis var. sinensis]
MITDTFCSQVLKVFPYPITITSVQFAVGTILVLFMWTSNLCRRPKISGAQLVAILPLAVVHTSGNLFTNMSIGKVAVSFTHTIKAMEPFFSVVLSAMFLGEESLDNITLFSIITIMSFFLLTPFTLFMEGVKVTPAYLQSAGLNVRQVYIRSLLDALCFHAYQQARKELRCSWNQCRRCEEASRCWDLHLQWLDDAHEKELGGMDWTEFPFY